MPIPAGPGTLPAWAQIPDVEAVTGVTPTEQQLMAGQHTVELHANAIYGDRIGARDLRWLMMAVAYQTAWLTTQIDIYSRTEVTSVNQDGMQYSPSHSDALTLAPLARRALTRLSWRRTGSVTTTPATIFHVDDDRAGRWVSL